MLATITQANAFERFDRLSSLLGDEIIRRGKVRENELLDRLLSATAGRIRGTSTRIEPRSYVTLRGFWQTSFRLPWASVWVLYDETTGRGIAGFSRPGAAPHEWFHVLVREELVDQRGAQA